MPMTFDSFDSVAPVAKYLGLRGPFKDESLEDYRAFVADNDTDKVQAMEMRTGKPWDKFTPLDNFELIRSFKK